MRRTVWMVISLGIVSALAPGLAWAQTAWMDLAKTPPMGWNSWNKFGCDVSEKLVKEMADALAASGMKDAGYQYIVIDDCWQVSRDASGTIVPDPKRFPAGIKAVADYVHAKGLKFGIYSDAGRLTCQHRPGSNGYEAEDARAYAAWGVDYLKYDWCHTEGVDPKIAYSTMRDALKATGRPVVFSMCEWGTSKPWTWARGVSHLWRTTEDILDCWDCSEDWGGAGWSKILDKQVGLEQFAGPGGWNDPDMLEVGNSGLTVAESRAHFSFWCLLAAPLMAGNDLRTMTSETKAILTNREVIAVDQDALGEQGRRIRKDGDLEVWMKKLAGGARAVILFNRGKTEQSSAVSWQEIDLPFDAELAVRDLWAKKDLGRIKDRFMARIPSHDVVMIRVAPAPAAAPAKGEEPIPQVLFDDFSYPDAPSLAGGGWTIRTDRGWPGIEGAAWGPGTIEVLDDKAQPGNRLVRMVAETNGEGSGTRQAQLCHARKYFEGTTAARIRFSNQPVSGPNGDQVVESFYQISPLVRDLDPNYSELDFEYLPNGGWGGVGPTLFATSWETVQMEPWQALNRHEKRSGSLDGWHVLVVQVAKGEVRYYLDGTAVTTHGGKVFPRVPMSLNFNLWFVREGLTTEKVPRIWREDIDWVMHVRDRVLSPAEVEAAVAAYRKAGTKQVDTVPVPAPPLPCPCNF